MSVEPSVGCVLCPRLAEFRRANVAALPEYFNRPVPSFGDVDARLLVVGLAPGLKGANRTGRPFTGDYAGDLLYRTLLDFGFAIGTYRADPSDGLVLVDCMITNAVRCVPPQNKPTGEEAATCRRFLAAPNRRPPEAAGDRGARAYLARQCAGCDGARRAAFKFAHGTVHDIGHGRALIDSYHCSRYNTNTGVLTEAMFRDVFAKAQALLQAAGDRRDKAVSPEVYVLIHAVAGFVHHVALHDDVLKNMAPMFADKPQVGITPPQPQSN